MFGTGSPGSMPSKGPEEAPKEEAPKEEAPAAAEAEDDTPAKAAGKGAARGGGDGGKEEAASPVGAEDAGLASAPGAAKWTSNIGNWFAAWKDGGEVEVRQLDAMSHMGENGIIMQGRLFKRGEAAGDAFRPRFISITKKHITYAVDDLSPAIDHIAFTDIVALCYHKPRVDTRAQDTGDNIVALHAAEAGEGVNNIQTVDDHTQEFQDRAKRLHVNIIFRDEVSESELEHVKDLELGQCEFCVVTSPVAYQRGRIFVFRAESRERAEVWQETLSRVLSCYANVPVAKCDALTMVRRKVHWFYMGDRCQVFVASLILSNFILNIFEAHFTPEEGSSMQNVFDKIDMGFTVVFTGELFINMFATLVLEFVRDSWNWFDTMVVSISLCTLFLPNVPGAKPLKLMRCFRVFRLFKRIPSLRQVLVPLIPSLQSLACKPYSPTPNP